MTLGRVIRALNAEHHSSIRAKWITKIFVLADIFCFCTQLGGAGIQVTGDRKIMDIGNKVVLSGLIFQIMVFCFFVYTAGKFHRRLNREPTSTSDVVRWSWYMHALYTASAAILVRNLIRVIEFAEGSDGFIISHEVMLYIFDAFLMFAVFAIFVAMHPGRLIKRAHRTEKAVNNSVSDLNVSASNYTTYPNEQGWMPFTDGDKEKQILRSG
jgi:hypothetical protein